MMASNEDFLEECVNDYESLMEDAFNQANSISELQIAHDEARRKIVEKLEAKWMEKFSGERLSPEFKQSIVNNVNSTFEQYKEYFETKQKTEQKRKSMNTLSLFGQRRDIAIGIDLGTTMCCVMVLIDGRIELIRNKSQGNVSTTPSYVAFLEDGSDTFGVVAKNRSYRFPELTLYDAKRLIGRTWNDSNLQSDRKSWPFEIVNENGNPKFKTGGRTRYPQEVSARLLSRLRQMAEEHLNLPKGSITKAVITVPAYFTEAQRRATNEAALCAGMEVLNILNEPSAAAIAYNYEQRETGKRVALVYDLGGGTFDVAIAEVKPNNVNVLSVDGDTHLGGQDFDQILMEYCIEEFKTSEGIDLLNGRESTEKTVRDKTKRALARLKLQCEKAKEELSGCDFTVVEVMGIIDDHNLEITIYKNKLEELVRPLVQRTLEIVEKAIASAVKSNSIQAKDDIDDVIMVGGSTRMPLVLQMVQEYFGGKQLCQSINPDEAVAYGAAVQAAILNKHRGIHPFLNVYDVLPLSLGVEVIGQRFSMIIPKHSRIPCEFEGIYTTVHDNQTTIKFIVFQGEHYKSTDNNWLGEFLLTGFPPKPRGEEEARVTMTIDFMGILHVTAVSLSTGNKEGIIISSEKLGMDAETIKKLSEELRPRPPAMP